MAAAAPCETRPTSDHACLVLWAKGWTSPPGPPAARVSSLLPTAFLALRLKVRGFCPYTSKNLVLFVWDLALFRFIYRLLKVGPPDSVGGCWRSGVVPLMCGKPIREGSLGGSPSGTSPFCGLYCQYTCLSRATLWYAESLSLPVISWNRYQ